MTRQEKTWATAEDATHDFIRNSKNGSALKSTVQPFNSIASAKNKAEGSKATKTRTSRSNGTKSGKLLG